VGHYEPPEVTWLWPELEVGVEVECRPVELELLELEDDELEELEPEDELEELGELEPEAVEPEDVEPEDVAPVEVEPVEVSVLWVEPGRARASAPAVTTLAIVTAVVVERTLLRPRSLAAAAWRIPSRSALLIILSMRSGNRNSLHEPSGKPLSYSPTAARCRARRSSSTAVAMSPSTIEAT
jgi:hypothetical protein